MHCLILFGNTFDELDLWILDFILWHGLKAITIQQWFLYFFLTIFLTNCTWMLIVKSGCMSCEVIYNCTLLIKQ